MMKILFLVRPDLFRIKAGDTIQITNLKLALHKLGLSVEISSDLKADLEGYDLVHCFNLLRVDICAYQCEWVKEKGSPLILTPIYWNMEEYLTNVQPDQLRWWYTSQEKRREVLKLVDLLAPDAEQEWQQLKRDFQQDLPYRVIYNGVDPVFYKPIKEDRDLILCVGRIHPRKNQLQLIKALRGTGLPLRFIGDVNSPHYYRQCLKEAAGENVSFLGGMEKRELIEIYQKARVHVLPSWYDTPGLVNLEAGLAGCNLVTTNRGTAREYLADLVLYCDPTDLREIREEVIKAYYTLRNNSLQKHILKRYTWDKIARTTVGIYSEFLS